MTVLAGLVGWVGIGCVVLLWWLRHRRDQAHAELLRLVREVDAPDRLARVDAAGLAFWRWRLAFRAAWIPLAPVWIASIVLAEHTIPGLILAGIAGLVVVWFAFRMRRIWREGIPEATWEPLKSM